MSPERSRSILATALTALAGYVDAVGFLQLGGTFVSFMSGNTTQLGVGMTLGGSLATPVAAIVLFVGGVVAGHWVRRAVTGRRQVAVLALVGGLLAVAGALGDAGRAMMAIAAATLAMGALNTLFEADGEVSVGVTYVTSTLVKVGDHLADALAGGPPWGWVGPSLRWAGLVAGAVVGTLAFRTAALDAVWAAAAASVLAAAWAVIWPAGD